MSQNNQNILQKIFGAIFGSKEEDLSTTERNDSSTDKSMKAFLQGKVIPLKELNDGVFSEGLVGPGLAILPENDTVFSPIDAEVTVLMQASRHACGLKLTNGVELLLHVGIDTVAMQGDGFSYHIIAGQKVKQGDPLISFDSGKIKAAGYSDATVCVLTEEGSASNISYFTGIDAVAKETTIITFE